MSADTLWGLEFLAIFVWGLMFLATGPSKTWVTVMWALLFAGSWHEDGWRWPVSLTLFMLSIFLFRAAWEIYKYQPTAQDFERAEQRRQTRDVVRFLHGRKANPEGTNTNASS